METRLQTAEALLARSEGQEALDNAIKAVELYIEAASRSSTRTEGLRLRRRCQELIAYAERLKYEINPGLAVEESILKDASNLHGNNFPPWRGQPEESEFKAPIDDLFRDDAAFTLSPAQLDTFGGWKRPTELFYQQGISAQEEDTRSTSDLDARFFTTPKGPCDLVQDVTTDCSVVAGLSAAINVLSGKHEVLSTIFHPFDHAQGRPRYSASGKYIMRLNFNGCFRKVVIDDTLPDSQTERTLFVVDRLNKQLLWPALLEKAYLKIRGGYDFPGSNSGTDLWVMTGWIPEQIFFQKEGFDTREVWSRIKTDHDAENVVITIGTGVISPEEEAATGLVGEHDYAIQGLREEKGMYWLLVKNPWCVGPVWTGGWQSSASTSLASMSSAIGAHPPEVEGDYTSSGAIWVSFEDVAQNFESMYLNWNPELFAYRTHRHFAWTMPSAYFASTLLSNPQFSLVNPSGGTVWVLFSRHFQDAELGLVKDRTNSGDTMAAAARQLGFMSIKVFDSGGRRVQIAEHETHKGVGVDSPQTLARINTSAGKAYTVVLCQDEFPLKKYTFTLSTFSHQPVQVNDAVEELAHTQSTVGMWTRRSAGGSAACPTYFSNPQFRVEIPSSTPLTIVIFSDKEDIPIHIDLVWGSGKRVTTIRHRDLVVSSGDHIAKRALAEVPRVDPGVYTLVCSTWEAGQTASFGLRVASDVPITLKPIAADAAGLLSFSLPRFVLSDGVEGIRAPVGANRLTNASVTARISSTRSGSNGAPLLRLSVIHGWGPNHVVIAVSGDGEYQDSIAELRTSNFDIEPHRVQAEGLWLVVEVMGLTSNGHALETAIFSDSAVQTDAWEVY